MILICSVVNILPSMWSRDLGRSGPQFILRSEAGVL